MTQGLLLNKVFCYRGCSVTQKSSCGYGFRVLILQWLGLFWLALVWSGLDETVITTIACVCVYLPRFFLYSHTYIFKGCARCGQREFVHRAVVPPILAPQQPASLG